MGPEVEPLSSQPPKLRPIKGGRVTVHDPEEQAGSARIIILPGDGGNVHTILEAKSFQPVSLAKAVTITVPVDALDTLDED